MERRSVIALRTDSERLRLRTDLYPILDRALAYVAEDPSSAATKCRQMLEEVLKRHYVHTFDKRLDRPVFEHLRLDQQFKSSMPSWIYNKVHFIRVIGNAGAHGEQVRFQEAYDAVFHTLDLLEWFIANSSIEALVVETGQQIEVLPQLVQLFGEFIRPEITSVRVHQNSKACYLEIVSDEGVGETINRTDLDFMEDPDPEEAFENALIRTIQQNAHRLLHETPSSALVMLTDLFTEEGNSVLWHSDDPRFDGQGS